MLDYTRSYITFTTKGRTNTARLLVESRCEWVDDATGATEEYFFFASCKSEDTYAPNKLFLDPNYDFCGIFSAKEFRLIRTRATYERDVDSVGPVESYFEEHRLLIHRVEGAERMADTPAIIAATLAGRPLVGRTEFAIPSLGGRALLEYPIKTINVNADRQMYQVDTGPLPFPDWNAPGPAVTARMVPAYVAYNRADVAEFVLQQPTPVLRDGHELCRVRHYSDIRELPARNTIYAL